VKGLSLGFRVFGFASEGSWYAVFGLERGKVAMALGILAYVLRCHGLLSVFMGRDAHATVGSYEIANPFSLILLTQILLA
jgi:hypothetical protein